MSQTRMDLSSELLTMMSCLAWNMTQETLLTCPRSVSTSHALVSFMRHSFTWRSSAPDTMSGNDGWNDAQFTPRSCPSRTYLTTASPPPNRSLFTLCAPRMPCESSPGATDFLRRPPMSHTLTVWSSDAETTKSSLGWNIALMT